MEKNTTFNNSQNQWIDVDVTDLESIDSVKEIHQLDDELLGYSLDQHERARMEYDPDDHSLLLIFNVPHREKTHDHYEASPLTFLLKDEKIFTFNTPRTAYVTEAMVEILKKNTEISEFTFLFKTLLYIADAYFPLVEEVNEERINLNAFLREKTSNKNLLALSDLAIGLVYLVSATNQNVGLLEQLKAHSICKTFTDDEQEKLDDVLIEARQAYGMTKLASEILEQLSGAYNNLLNNNLNDTMKLLTIWSLILTVPTIVTGFYGMNVDLPFQDSVLAWALTIIISLGLSLWLLLIIWRRIK